MSQGTKLLALVSTLETQSSTLRNLFSERDYHLSRSFKHDLKKLIHYYERSFWETSSLDKRAKVIKEYQFLVSTTEEVNNGTLSAQEALKKIDEVNQNRKNKILVDNIIKTCELLFWIAVAVLSCTLCLTVGVPLTQVNPLLGAALTIASSLCVADALLEASDCMDEFKSSGPIRKQEKRERTIISFFNKPSLERDEEYQTVEASYDLDGRSEASSCY